VVIRQPFKITPVGVVVKPGHEGPEPPEGF
jgi:hypothetical protein